MRKFLLFALLLISIGSYSQTNNYQDTQGKFEVSENGQAIYTLPIALPPSIGDVGPTINLIYASGQLGGIAGQGWSINSISAISRISTRKDLDGYVDGVDFDANDKLALDGQRLQLVSGNYWEDGSVYKTEILSNSKIELFGSGTSIYFIVTNPDGSRSWYGNYGGMYAVDLTAFYIVRFEDVNGNFITYHYSKPFNKGLCISEIKFSANVNGLQTPLNSLQFNYKLAKRAEYAYIKGVKHEKAELLDNIQVKTNNELFRKYQLTHIVDPQLGYERVSQIQEFNGALEPANPVIFEYDTTTTLINGSEYLTNYSNNLNFSDIILSGDFDEDGNLDFVTENKLYKKLFQNSTGTTINLPFTINKDNSFVATTLSDNKLNQFQSIVKHEGTSFKIYNLVNSSIQLSYEKPFNFPFHMNCFYPAMPPCDNIKNKFLEGDFNGDGVSEVIMYSVCEREDEITIMNSVECDFFYWIDLNPNISSEVANLFTSENAPGAVILNNSDWLRGIRYVSDFNGDGKSEIFVVNRYSNDYKIIGFKQLAQNPWVELEILGEGNLDEYSFTKQLLLGDYNGDGKTDIMLPDTEGGPNQSLWHIYYSNPKPTGGSFFEKESHNIVEYWPNTGSYYDTQVHFSKYYALDTNGDGKSDLVRIWRNYYEPSWTINDHDTQWKVTTYVNNIGNTQLTNKFTLDYLSPCYNTGIGQNCNHDSDSPDLPIPIVSNYRFKGLSKELIMVRNHYNQVTYIDFKKEVTKDARITKVTSSGGNLVNEVEYATMESSSSNNGLGNLNEFYSSSNSVNYPYLEIKRLPTNYL
ncbi:FG-GAP-like repeat-containing protein, partial [Flavobacterium sp. J27]|uniref:FG-GAP-like repeat-containing protein n=1 Tax=Flavobacterium sp. J27 TaxID=2060419 RepID=UPI00197A9142